MTNSERVTPAELLQFLSAHANNPPYIPERDDEPEAPAPLSPEREAEIRKRINRLDDDRVMTGSTWLASPVGIKSVFPPEQSHVVEDVLKTRHAVIRGSVGVFADKQHAEFMAHARDDIPALLAELDRVRAERDELKRRVADARKAAINDVGGWLARIGETGAAFIVRTCYPNEGGA